MGDETEFKTVVLRSNIRTEDSLTSFGNPVPAQFLNPYYEHEVALTGFGLHCQFKNAGSPMNAIYPSLIQIFKMDFKSATGYDDPSLVKSPLKLSSLIKNNEGFYLEENAEYTPETLTDYLTKSMMMKYKKLRMHPRGKPAKFKDGLIHFSQFEFPWERLDPRIHEGYKTVLFFHERLADCLDLKALKSSVMVEKERYYYFTPNDQADTIMSSKNITIKVPKVLKICSPNVQSSIVENTMTPFLRQVAMPSREDLGNNQYFSYNFKTFEFVKTLKDFNNIINIQFLDENKEKIRVSNGFASYVILQVKSRPAKQYE